MHLPKNLIVFKTVFSATDLVKAFRQSKTERVGIIVYRTRASSGEVIEECLEYVESDVVHFTYVNGLLNSLARSMFKKYFNDANISFTVYEVIPKTK